MENKEDLKNIIIGSATEIRSKDVLTFEINGITYIYNDNDDNDTVSVIRPNGYVDEYTGNIDIPSSVTIEGKEHAVTRIEDCAFYKCSGLISIKLPDSVTSIGDNAFYYCQNLKSVEGNNVTCIGKAAFYGCCALSHRKFHKDVIIGVSAFVGCPN